MKKVFAWSEWSIATKILVVCLGLSVISMAIIAYIALSNINELGTYALETSNSLGESAIRDSTAHLNKLGEDIVKQKAQDVAKQVEMYFNNHPNMNLTDMRNDTELRSIVVQPVGTQGYTTLIDPINTVIIIHKYQEQEKNISPLKDVLPSFWALIESSSSGETSSGYYDWLEVDGSTREKYASIAPIVNANGYTLTLWATTYIAEFSQPAEQTKQEINAAILISSNFISNNVSNMKSILIIIFILMLFTVIVMALLVSRAITSPIMSLKKGAEEIGKGNVDYKLVVKSRDELGDLANSFNKMSSDLKNYIEELKSTAAENISKEKIIQENIRIYLQKLSQVQEEERKRIARDLHDETIQALVVVSRHLEDLTSGNSKLSVEEIREEVRKITTGVRRFSRELRPSVLDDLGLTHAVQWLASDLTENYGIMVKTRVKGNQIQLPAESELMLFRIVQEALANVRKHSQATEASITIDFSEHNITINIKDNGKGFNIPSGTGDLAKTGKLGMIGMLERAQLLGGTLSIKSKPGEGTNLEIEIPLQKISGK
jgi:two-component system sensor histidine kinase DegS